MLSADGIPSDTFSKHPLHLRYIAICTHRDCIYIYSEHIENIQYIDLKTCTYMYILEIFHLPKAELKHKEHVKC